MPDVQSGHAAEWLTVLDSMRAFYRVTLVGGKGGWSIRLGDRTTNVVRFRCISDSIESAVCMASTWIKFGGEGNA